MKKQTALALAAVFSLSVAGTALAAPANPFVDVPAKHWAYDSINQLAKAGVISGYGDGTYKGDRTLTRYEIAVIIGKAMANSDKADAEAKKAIEALKAEFGTELNNLGVRVDNLEKKIDNVTITGQIRARYDDNKYKFNGQDLGSEMLQSLRTRVVIKGQINEDWSYTGRLQNVHNMRTTGVTADGADKFAPTENKTDLNWAFVQGKVGVFGVTAGRFDVTPAYGIALDDTVDGVMFSFGNKLKVDLFAGKEDYSELLSASDRNNTYIANLGYSFSDKLNAKAAYFAVDYNATGVKNAKLYEVGMDYQVTPTVNVKGVYLKSNQDVEDKGYFTEISYKGADISKVGTFGAWVNYRNLEATTLLSSTLDVSRVGVGGKGYEVGFNYVPMKNGKWTTTYTDLKDTAVSNLKGKFFRTEMNFYF